jgi:hypothetical protein
MDRILEIRDDTVTAQAGALYIDVNYELLKRNLQFYVNVELGNLTIGSACCGGTKDASMPGEFGQVASYAVGIKMVTPAGELVEITESDPELLQVARSSYGLFGIVYEATFKVRPLAALAVHHETFSLDEFAQQLPALKARGESMMMYINPFLDRITVEFRRYHGAPTARDLTDWQWKIRDRVWSYLAPLYTYYVTRYVTLARPALCRPWQQHQAASAADQVPGRIRHSSLHLQHLGFSRNELHRGTSPVFRVFSGVSAAEGLSGQLAERRLPHQG